MHYRKLDDFFEDSKEFPHLRLWLHEHGLSIYIRNSTRRIGKELVPCIDVANVNADPQGQGKFTAFMEQLEATGVNIYVENVLNVRLGKWFMRRNYEPVMDTHPKSYILRQVDGCSHTKRVTSASRTRD